MEQDVGRHYTLPVLLLLALMGAFLASSEPGQNQPTYQINFSANAPRTSRGLALSSDGSLLLVVNPDSGTLSVVDTDEKTVVVELATGADPRSVALDEAGGLAYVANRGSDSVTVIDLSNLKLIDQLPVGRQPYGLVTSPQGKYLYVAEQGSGRLRIIETGAYKTVRQIHLGDRPSGLALTGDGQKLYVTHLLSNKIAVLDLTRPYGFFLPIVRTGALPLASVQVDQLFDSGPTPGFSQALFDSILLWPDSNLVQAIALDPAGQTAYLPHTRANTSNENLTFDTTVIPLVSLIDVASDQHLRGQQFDLATLDPPGVGLPFDAAVSPDGDALWVVNGASNDLTVINLTTRNLLGHIEVGHNPRAIVLSPDGSTAYINNTLEGTVSVVDTAALTVTEKIPVTDIPLPPLLLLGKRLFHSSDDPRMANAQWIACSTCHFDGGHDGRTWTFGFAGPRNTTSLMGMVETYPLRWSGEWDESADGEFAIRKENFGTGLLQGTVHCALAPVNCVDQPPNQGRSPDLDALAAFMDSLAIPLSPGHAQGQPLIPAEERGRDIFQQPDLGCIDCHPPPLYTDRQSHDVGTATADEKIGPAYDTPTLRGLYSSAPYFHDGGAVSLHEALAYPSPDGEHDLSGRLSTNELLDLIHYLMALPYE